MNKEDIEFLNSLQNEMNTQDTCCQANPRFWVVMQTKRLYGIEEDYGIDGVIITSHNDPEFSIKVDDMEEIWEWLDEEFDCELSDGVIKINNDYKDELYNVDDVIDFLEREGKNEYYLVNYRDDEEIVLNTFFLTKRECEEHIKRNRYHYKNPMCYAMTAWRSPQVERLYKILQETNWEQFKEDIK